MNFISWLLQAFLILGFSVDSFLIGLLCGLALQAESEKEIPNLGIYFVILGFFWIVLLILILCLVVK